MSTKKKTRLDSILSSIPWKGATTREIPSHHFERAVVDCGQTYCSQCSKGEGHVTEARTAPAIEIRHPSGAVAYLLAEGPT